MVKPLYPQIIKELKKQSDPVKARLLQGFFKTGPGQYGEGDKFWGVIVPRQRQVAKKYADASLKDLQQLLHSQIHEQRLTALIILTGQYQRADDQATKKSIFDFYLKNTARINNWDLVDVSAPRIVGYYLLDKNRKVIYRLARSKNLWQRRIAIIATAAFIQKGQFADTLKISRLLITDSHDLIHKAVGWMLREVGKKDRKTLLDFLDRHAAKMPRTMLRYAIEKLPEKTRQEYLRR